jgi:tRNA G10  N-methylase Trm11
VTKEGSEIYVLPEHHPEYKTHIGLIQGYQQIDLYEAIDINKPLSGMTIGMMPSKLAHMLMNIALAQTPDVQDPTIFDPFCGFGTTNFIANALGYHTI